jgi:hypothetical protein
MRKLLFIAILFSTVAHSQVALPSYQGVHFHVASSDPVFTPPLDADAATVAYSFRKLRTAYAGSAVRVRRSSDNTESDIGFTANGNFDATAFSSFIGAGSGYIVTWYDQSGNGVNATQATTSAQPQILLSQVNSKPALSIASGQYLDLTTSLFAAKRLDIFYALKITSYSANGAIYFGSNANTLYWQHATTTFFVQGANASASAIAINNSAWRLMNSYSSGTTQTTVFNTTSYSGTATIGTIPAGSITYRMFRYGTASNWDVIGSCAEFIIYANGSAARTTTRDNIISYFGL